MIAGYPEYPPMTTTNVPKYLTPIDTSARLMAKPTRDRTRPAATNGERFLMRSDQMPQTTTERAATTLLDGRHDKHAGSNLTSSDVRRHRQQLGDGWAETKAMDDVQSVRDYANTQTTYPLMMDLYGDNAQSGQQSLK